MPQGQMLLISLRDVSLSMVVPLRVRVNFWLPTAMDTWNAEAPATASNTCMFEPDVTVTFPADVSSATMNTASCIESDPSGRPIK